MPFDDLPARVAAVRERIAAAAARGGYGQQVVVVAVTKTHGVEAVRAALDAGLADVGENRVQEALEKMTSSPGSVRWHLIGHLQRNKVKSLERFHLFHALDSRRLAEAVNAAAAGWGRPMDALVQVNVSGEGTKGGFTPAEVAGDAEWLAGLASVRVRGVMTMAPYDADESTLRRVFSGARAAREVLRRAGCEANELSMGMSNDFELAVEEGATRVRLGTVLFGARSA